MRRNSNGAIPAHGTTGLSIRFADMSAPPIDAVLIDVGGVLVLPNEDLVADALARIGHDVDRTRLPVAHYHGAAALEHWPDTEDGTHRDAAVYGAFNEAYARAVGVPSALLEKARRALDEVFGHIDMWTHPAPGAREGLEALSRTDRRLAIVSNANGQVEDVLADLGLCQVGPGGGVELDAIIDSHLVGVAKPHPRIFHLALERVGVEPERAIHVGDVVGADVEGARGAGVTPVHFDPYRLCAGDDHAHTASLVELAGRLG